GAQFTALSRKLVVGNAYAQLVVKCTTVAPNDRRSNGSSRNIVVTKPQATQRRAAHAHDRIENKTEVIARFDFESNATGAVVKCAYARVNEERLCAQDALRICTPLFSALPSHLKQQVAHHHRVARVCVQRAHCGTHKFHAWRQPLCKWRLCENDDVADFLAAAEHLTGHVDRRRGRYCRAIQCDLCGKRMCNRAWRREQRDCGKGPSHAITSPYGVSTPPIVLPRRLHVLRVYDDAMAFRRKAFPALRPHRRAHRCTH